VIGLKFAQICAISRYDGARVREKDPKARSQSRGCRFFRSWSRQAALSPARRAAEIREKLAQDNPAAYLPDLAMSLRTLGHVLQSVDDLGGAVSAYADALKSFRTCFDSAPQRFAPYLALTAERLGEALVDAGRSDETEPMLRAILGVEPFGALRSARSAN
jgi:hypothetical protein